MQNLDDVPSAGPCPQCGSHRRSAQVSGSAALVGVSAMPGTVTVGYNQEPSWTYQWEIIQRHLARLREQYEGVDTRGNLDVEETVSALLLALNHVSDWLYQDQATGLTKDIVQHHVRKHPTSLGVCKAYANAFKHMRLIQPGWTVARIDSIGIGPNGYKVTLTYGPGNQSHASYARADALDLAERSEQAWRQLLIQHGIPIPG
jgi:hypothetical protein